MKRMNHSTYDTPVNLWEADDTTEHVLFRVESRWGLVINTHTQEQHVPLGGESWEQRDKRKRKRRALAALVGVWTTESSVKNKQMEREREWSKAREYGRRNGDAINIFIIQICDVQTFTISSSHTKNETQPLTARAVCVILPLDSLNDLCKSS